MRKIINTAALFLDIPMIYFVQNISTEVRSYIKLMNNKNKYRNIKCISWRFVNLIFRYFSVGMAILFRVFVLEAASRWKVGREKDTRKERRRGKMGK